MTVCLMSVYVVCPQIFQTLACFWLVRANGRCVKRGALVQLHSRGSYRAFDDNVETHQECGLPSPCGREALRVKSLSLWSPVRVSLNLQRSMRI